MGKKKQEKRDNDKEKKDAKVNEEGILYVGTARSASDLGMDKNNTTNGSTGIHGPYYNSVFNKPKYAWYIRFMDFFIYHPYGRHLYSFMKTWPVVFLGEYLILVETGNDIYDFGFIKLAAGAAALSCLRNLYKVLTEKNVVYPKF